MTTGQLNGVKFKKENKWSEKRQKHVFNFLLHPCK